jgi:hypothetical protein
MVLPQLINRQLNLKLMNCLQKINHQLIQHVVGAKIILLILPPNLNSPEINIQISLRLLEPSITRPTGDKHVDGS